VLSNRLGCLTSIFVRYTALNILTC